MFKYTSALINVFWMDGQSWYRNEKKNLFLPFTHLKLHSFTHCETFMHKVLNSPTWRNFLFVLLAFLPLL